MTRFSSFSAIFVLTSAASAAHKDRFEPLDLGKGVKIASRIACDGATAPEDHIVLKAAFSPGGYKKSFVLDTFEKERCKVDAKVKCLDKQKEGWYRAWSMNSAAAPGPTAFPLASCYQWGATEPAQYVLSAWYKDSASDPKFPWKQAVVRQVSTEPEIYEFKDPNGGGGRLEIERR